MYGTVCLLASSWGGPQILKMYFFGMKFATCTFDIIKHLFVGMTVATFIRYSVLRGVFSIRSLERCPLATVRWVFKF